MARLEHIKDPETLQQVASHLEKTVLRQQQTIAQLQVEVARLKGQDIDPQMELTLLKEQLAAMQRKLYGSSSERQPSSSGKLQDEKRKQTGHGPREQPDLPLEVVEVELPEDERACSVCGGDLEEMSAQYESTQTVTVIEIDYKVVEHRRKKYRCRCNGNVVTAPMPEGVKLQSGGRYSIDFAVHVAEQKYLDHMPLERQVRAMARRGLVVESQTLWDQTDVLARLLEPTVDALHATILEAEVVHVDESRWPLMTKGKTSTWWTWCVATDDMVVYRNARHRDRAAAKRLLNGYGGIVMSDGYNVYKSLQRDGPKTVTKAYCWAHVRRKYLEAEGSYPELSRHAVERINELFRLERQLPKPGRDAADEDRAAASECRRELRATKSKPIADRLLEWALENRGCALPKSKMGKAMESMIDLWPGLKSFLDDPRIPLDNNAAERALRGVVVGRKNHYGSRSKRGTEVAAILYSVFETARLSDIDPVVYVREAARRAIIEPDAATLPEHLT